jgi:HlyD family secretion protein
MKRIIALGLVAALAACGHKAAVQEQVPVVATSVASTGDIQPTSEMSGIVAPYYNVAIQSTLTEPADTVNVQEGDHVTKGEVLAQLDTADLRAELQSDVATAQSDAANTEHTVYSGTQSITQGNQGVLGAQATLLRDRNTAYRDETLLRQGYVSQQQVDVDEAAVRNDQAALQSAIATEKANGPSLTAPGLQQSAIAQAKAQEQIALAQANQVRVSIDKATIASPIDGVVVNRNLNVGEYPGSRQIFTLQQVAPIYAILRGASEQIMGVSVGSPATITALGSSGHSLKLTGKVVGILNQIQPGSTQFQVKVLLDNPGETLRPGMAVMGNIDLPIAHGLRVPSTAFTDDNHTAVQIVQSDGIVKTLQVTEVATDGSTSVVKGQLAEGDRVIDNGQLAIGDGQKVSYKQ